jgi:hypothetical protein
MLRCEEADILRETCHALDVRHVQHLVPVLLQTSLTVDNLSMKLQMACMEELCSQMSDDGTIPDKMMTQVIENPCGDTFEARLSSQAGSPVLFASSRLDTKTSSTETSSLIHKQAQLATPACTSPIGQPHIVYDQLQSEHACSPALGTVAATAPASLQQADAADRASQCDTFLTPDMDWRPLSGNDQNMTPFNHSSTRSTPVREAGIQCGLYNGLYIDENNPDSTKMAPDDDEDMIRHYENMLTGAGVFAYLPPNKHALGVIGNANVAIIDDLCSDSSRAQEGQSAPMQPIVLCFRRCQARGGSNKPRWQAEQRGRQPVTAEE